MSNYNSILIVGPTASGKTKLAVRVAAGLNGEIISLDSRQVYKHLNIGTGKDLEEYNFNGKTIPYQLIDIVEPTEKYHVARFQNDFQRAFAEISKENRLPVLCGGTGLYMDVVLKEQHFIHVPVDEKLREELMPLDRPALLLHFNSLSSDYHKHADTSTHKRLIRAIEIATYLTKQPFTRQLLIKINPLIIGVQTSLEERRMRIAQRLKNRIDNGLIEEVETLLTQGVNHEQLEYLGLEYKFISHYLQGKLNREIMIERLTVAIQQYAKRQMTWFRKMEREGVRINWIDRSIDITAVETLYNKS